MDQTCMQPEEAIRQLKIGWGVLLAATAVLLGVLMIGAPLDVTLPGAAEASGAAESIRWWAMWTFTWLSAVWLATMVPLAFILRSHCFMLPMVGRAVEPASYVRGMTTVWGALKVALVLSAVGCMLGGAMLPGIIPGVLAAMLLGLTMPSASAMSPAKSG